MIPIFVKMPRDLLTTEFINKLVSYNECGVFDDEAPYIKENNNHKASSQAIERSYGSFYVGVMPGHAGALYVIADYKDLQLKTNFIFL